MSEVSARELSRDPRVALVEQAQLLAFNSAPTAVTVQPFPGWGLDRIDQASGTNYEYRYANSGEGVNIYVIDNGIRISHQDFQNRAIFGAIFLNGGGVQPPIGPPPPGSEQLPCPDKFHGTAIASIAGGKDYGVAKKATLIDVQVAIGCAGPSSDDVVQAINWVVSDNITRPGPAVVNASIAFTQVTHPAIILLEIAFRDAAAAGVVVVAAAGNQNMNAGGISPARLDEVIAVSAIDDSDTRASFLFPQRANYGAVVDLFAPGGAVLAAWSESDTMNRLVSGTSYAAPYVTGIAARYLELYPSAGPTEVRNAIVDAASEGVLGAGPATTNLIAFTGFLDQPVPPPPPPGGRWKDDGYGGCYWDQYDSGPHQCDPDLGRWKDDGNGGCYWDEFDTGPDQCSQAESESAILFGSTAALAVFFFGVGHRRTGRQGQGREDTDGFKVATVASVDVESGARWRG